MLEVPRYKRPMIHPANRAGAGAILAALIVLAPGSVAVAQLGAPPQTSEDRPYDGKLLRLSEILGAIHYLRELCDANEGQTWREQMREILRAEGTTTIRRAQLVNGFNQGYRGYSRTYRSCTESAKTAIARFMHEGSQIAGNLAREGR